MHLTFPHFSIEREIPHNNDLSIDVEELNEADFAIPAGLCNGGRVEDLQLEGFDERLHYLNSIFRAHRSSQDARHLSRVMTLAQRKKQQEQLIKALGNENNPVTNNDDKTISASNLPRDQINNNGFNDDVPPDKISDDILNAVFQNGLPDRYLQEGVPDKDFLDRLKELNIHDLKDRIDVILNNDNNNNNNNIRDQPFAKEQRAPPPQYHLESSRGETKERVTAYDLQTHFGGRKLQDFSLLSQLGTGISVINNINDVPTIGELVNRKRGQRKRKGKRAASPLEVVGMDIGYGKGTLLGGYKYVLLLVDQCTTESFVYGMHGSSGADVCEALWKFFIDAGGFPKTIQCDFDPRLIGGKAAALL